MSSSIDLNLAVGAALLVLGGIGFCTRRNLILIVLSAELMLHGVGLTLVTFSRMHGGNQGQAFTIFLLTVAACEAGLALALILAVYQKTRSLDINLWTAMREDDLAAPPPDPAVPAAPTNLRDLPRLTPSGRPPQVDGSDERTLLAAQEGAARPAASPPPAASTTA
jgi:NADH-quinone oxidoreductase subunit K